MSMSSTHERVIILGAAGRDFHDFQVYWSLEPTVEVVCFTAKQIPGIENRIFPPEMCKNEENGNKYPNVSTVHVHIYTTHAAYMYPIPTPRARCDNQFAQDRFARYSHIIDPLQLHKYAGPNDLSRR